MLAAALLVPAGLHAQTAVTNSAAASYETFAGTDSVASNSVETTLVFPDLFIDKLLGGPSPARIGDQIAYTIRYGNSSATVLARDAVLSDTLPIGLEFVSSQPPAQVDGQILTWNLGDVAPGEASEIALTVQVSGEVRDTLRVSNTAILAALNSSAQVATAGEVELIGVTSTQLSLDKSADVLEVGLGETVPYTLTLENTGFVPLSDLRIHDRLPEGGRYAKGSLLGADSVHADARDLTIFVAGPVAPGATHTVRYAVAVVSAETEVLENAAYATAENEFVRSEDVVAWVRVRRNWPMETRAAIGKVWVDLNGNGGQDPGEPGLEGADIWTDDGEVSSTDAEGKFSFRNLRPGRHAFRLDPATLPAAYRLPGRGSGNDLVVLDADGWTTPRINFRLIPRGGRLVEVRLPVSWRFTARPLCASLRDVFPKADGNRATLAHFESNSARLEDPAGVAQRVAQALARYPECRVEISGHSDRHGSLRENWQLSVARANSVARHLRALGLEAPDLIVRGYGSSQPLATGSDAYSRWRNRRVDLELIAPGQNGLSPLRPMVEYEVVIVNDYSVPLRGLAVRFEPVADSVVVLNGDSALAHLTGQPVPLPPIPPHSRVKLRGWTVSGADSAVAVLETDHRSAGRLFAQVHNFVIPVSGVAGAHAAADTLPSPRAVPPGAIVEAIIEPAAAGWPELTYRLPRGWELVRGSVRVGGVPAPDPEVRRDRTGEPSLYWRFRGRPMARLSLQLRPAGATEPVEPVRIAALRTAEEREAEKKRAFIAGPGVEIFVPRDGTVYRSDRVYIGVRGEAGAPVALFDGDSLIAQGNLRIDGIHDFIGVGLSRGPHRLRVRVMNSWKQERWDSVAVHVTGLPATFVPEREPIRLTADGHSTAELRLRILDRWGVPIVNRAYVTVSAEGAEPIDPDEDAASVGTQVRSDPAGWLTVQLRPGRDVVAGKLFLKAGEATRQIDLEILPAIRPLMLTGVGRIGLGASPNAFGALTARGRLDRRTSVILSYDSRRLDAGRDIFGRSFDPLEQAQYPILGDASQRRSVSASRYAFSARLERGFDWLAVGDIVSGEFTSGLSLTTYQRALSGAAARITTGPIVWRGFGSTTDQNLQQVQIRGDGISGPYELQPDIRAGTEQIVVETRARENPQRILSRQVLVRFIDYQIDYDRGTLLFKRPVPAADTYENPVFIVVTYEAESAGSQHAVWGLRASVNARSPIGSDWLDSLRVGTTWIRDGQPGGEFHLAGADVRLLRHGGLDVGAEVSYSQSPDSSGFATAVDGSLRLLGSALNLSAGWMKIGSEFHNPSNIALRGGTEEIKLAGSVRVGPSELRIEHERQSFAAEDVERQRTSGGIVQSLGPHLQVDARVTADRFENGTDTDESQAGELKITWAPASNLSLWTETRRLFARDGNVVRPDYIGGGAAFRVTPNLSLEARHREVLLPDDSTNYSITNLGVRTNIGFGTEAWGSYQIAGSVDGAHNAAVIGLNNRLKLGAAWSINTLFERRVGLDRASIADPVRALPFLQAEEDYWSAGLGIEVLPPDAPYRVTARAEYRDGDARSTRLVTVAYDVSLNRSLAVLSRQEFLQTEQNLSGRPAFSQRLSVLWGLAFRPIKTDALNVLTKFEWVDETNPIGGGVLARQGDEQRLIGAAEMIWAPFSWSELAGRYAIRRTLANRLHDDGVVQELQSWADYIGGRFNLDVTRWLAFRSEGRLLIERTSNSRRWDAAPSLVLIPIEGFEVAAGHRFGDLRDPDFAVRGGHGWFANFGIRLTEHAFSTAADFWRARLGR